MAKSIIFNQHQVNYALKNEEGVFRVVIKNSNLIDLKALRNLILTKDEYESVAWILQNEVKSPYQLGDKAWVKEAFGEKMETKQDSELGLLETKVITYKATDPKAVCAAKKDWYCLQMIWQKPQYMKQEHSRLTLRIKSVKVERLQDISEEDCFKEGIGYTGGWNGEDYDDGEFYFGKLTENDDLMSWKNEMFEYAEEAFAEYWNSTHKKPEEKFEASPWIFRYEYEVVR